MSSWIKSPKPAAAPPPARKIDVAALHRHAQDVQRTGAMPPQLAALVAAAPPDVLDRWGMPLPLAAPAQARLDRIGAILADPWHRPRALLRAGQLGPDEVKAMQDGRPQELQRLADATRMEMITAGPPLPQWVEAQLAILFQKPSDKILTAGGPDKDETPSKTTAKPPAGQSADDSLMTRGTPSDRRELAVRIGK